MSDEKKLNDDPETKITLFRYIDLQKAFQKADKSGEFSCNKNMVVRVQLDGPKQEHLPQLDWSDVDQLDDSYKVNVIKMSTKEILVSRNDDGTFMCWDMKALVYWWSIQSENHSKEQGIIQLTLPGSEEPISPYNLALIAQWLSDLPYTFWGSITWLLSHGYLKFSNLVNFDFLVNRTKDYPMVYKPLRWIVHGWHMSSHTMSMYEGFKQVYHAEDKASDDATFGVVLILLSAAQMVTILERRTDHISRKARRRITLAHAWKQVLRDIPISLLPYETAIKSVIDRSKESASDSS